MITDEDIARINFLAKKLKSEGLTSTEAEEQKFLRRAFIDNIKSQVKQQLESIEYVEDINSDKKCGHGCSCGQDHHGHHHGKHEHEHVHGENCSHHDHDHDHVQKHHDHHEGCCDGGHHGKGKNN